MHNAGEQVMPASSTHGRDGTRFAVSDLALLDRFIEAALAEDADARELVRNASPPAWSAGDDPEAFLTRTIGFLETRADRAELLARLNRAFAVPVPEYTPNSAQAPDPTQEPPPPPAAPAAEPPALPEQE
jgi:hypothetical protein